MKTTSFQFSLFTSAGSSVPQSSELHSAASFTPAVYNSCRNPSKLHRFFSSAATLELTFTIIFHNFVSSFDSSASESHTFSQASLSFTSTRGSTSFLHRRLFPFWLFACFPCFVFLTKGHIWEAETEKQFDLDGVVILPIQDPEYSSQA
ncbi:hypothetical protein K1719_022679 [Acacia pycnantha]|nr:hypothetical protein K1719_022679 [Acacia pycnantha]